MHKLPAPCRRLDPVTATACVVPGSGNSYPGAKVNLVMWREAGSQDRIVDPAGRHSVQDESLWRRTRSRESEVLGPPPPRRDSHVSSGSAGIRRASHRQIRRVVLAGRVAGKSGKTEQLTRPLWPDSLGLWALILPRHRPLHWPLLPGYARVHGTRSPSRLMQCPVWSVDLAAP